MKITKYLGVEIPKKYQADNERALAFAIGKLVSEERLDSKLSSINYDDSNRIKIFARDLRSYGGGDCNLDAILPSVKSNPVLSRKLSLDLAYTCGLGFIPEENINIRGLEKNVRWSSIRDAATRCVQSGKDAYSVISAMHRNPSFIPWDCWSELDLAGFKESTI